MLESEHRARKEYRNARDFQKVEMDPNTLLRRQEYHEDNTLLRRQEYHEDYGQNTIGYDNYFKLIPSYKRKIDRPMTPNKYQKCSQSSWDGDIEPWRISHHQFDNINSIPRSSSSQDNFPVSKIRETSTSDSEIDETLKNDWEFKVQDFEHRARKEYRNARDYCWKLEVDKKGYEDGRIFEKVEMDPNTLVRRQKDIDYGKNTIGYDNYIKSIPRHKHEKDHRKTPNKYQKCSRRSWDGQIKHWRILLHQFDNINSIPKYSSVYSSEAFNENHREGRGDIEEEEEEEEEEDINFWHWY